MKKYLLRFRYTLIEFDIEVSSLGSWADIHYLGEHMARQLQVELLTVDEIEEDDLK